MTQILGCGCTITSKNIVLKNCEKHSQWKVPDAKEEYYH